MMPGTSLPTSTLSYHLDASCYFREPAARVHLHHWKVLRFMQGAFAALFLGYYFVVNTVSQGRAAEEFSWVPTCALISSSSSSASQSGGNGFVRHSSHSRYNCCRRIKRTVRLMYCRVGHFVGYNSNHCTHKGLCEFQMHLGWTVFR